MAIKNNIFVEANVMNISESFSFMPLMVSEEMIFSQIYPYGCHGNHQIQQFGQNSYV